MQVIQTCQQLYTGSINGNCSTQCAYPNAIPNYKVCTIGAGLGCSAAGVCQPYHTSGPCTGAADGTCGDPTINAFDVEEDIYACLNTTNGYQCGAVFTLLGAAGDSCVLPTDCADSIPCNGGICQGTANGGNCNFDASCVFGSYCSKGMCAAFIPTGGNCAANPNGCNIITDVCGFGGFCVTALTVPSGGNCANIGECAAGLTCNPLTQKCAPPPPTTKCNVETDCLIANLGDCMCNPDGTKSCSNSGPNTVSLPTQCAKYNTQLNACANQFKCKGGVTAGTCFAKNCQKQANCFAGCAFSALLAPGNGIPPNCFQNNFPCTGGTATIGVAWLLLSVIISFLF